MRYEHLRIEVEGRLATVTLNRPEVRNAMDERTLAELEDCFSRLGAAPGKSAHDVRAIVLRGEGPDFCAGADIRWMRRASEYTAAKNRKDAYRLVRTIKAVDECPVPVVARVHGGVYGGGLGLVSACDVVVAESGARMCFSECRLGILPAVVTSFVLPKIGMSHTRRLYLTSEVFGMETALRVGLVHETAEPARLDAKVSELVKSILRNGPKAVRLSKGYLRRMESLPRAARIKLSVETLIKARSSAEGKEGFSAFLEKRKPRWLSE